MARCELTERAVSLVALLDGRARVLLLRREAGVHCGGFWSLPGGKQRAGESEMDCARRELLEETGVAAGGWRLCHRWRFRYPEVALDFTLFQARCDTGAEVRAESPWCWRELDSLKPEMFPPANAEIMPLRRWLAV